MERVERLWPDSTIVVLASGPSLTQADVDWCRGKAPVIAISDTHRLAPWADVLYSCDASWWNYYRGVPEFKGLKYTIQKAAGSWPGVKILDNTGTGGLERLPTGLKTGQNSGYQAVNLAVHFGAKRILLLGYDLQAIHGKGKSHFFGDHPGDLRKPSPYQLFVERFSELVEPLKSLGISVVNCSRETALTYWPRMPIQEALP